MAPAPVCLCCKRLFEKGEFLGQLIRMKLGGDGAYHPYGGVGEYVPAATICMKCWDLIPRIEKKEEEVGEFVYMYFSAREENNDLIFESGGKASEGGRPTVVYVGSETVARIFPQIPLDLDERIERALPGASA